MSSFGRRAVERQRAESGGGISDLRFDISEEGAWQRAKGAKNVLGEKKSLSLLGAVRISRQVVHLDRGQ
jgi:hypothetical protein